MNKHRDMYFVIEHDGNDYKILKVAYSETKARELLQSMTMEKVV